MARWHIIVVLLMPVTLAACSTQSWYHSMQEGGRQQCRQNPDAEAVSACLNKLAPKSSNDYEQYEQARPR